jgi:hypothetical protein
MWKRIQNWLSIVADLLQISGFLGLTPATILSVVAVVAGWGSVSIFWIVIATPVVFATTLFLTLQIAPRIGTLSLREGARRAYEELRGTLWATAAERLAVDKTPDGILDYLGTGISAEIPIFGKYPPSTRLERIKDFDLKAGSIARGATVLQLRDARRTEVVDLTIRKSDFRKAVKLMGEEAT